MFDILFLAFRVERKGILNEIKSYFARMMKQELITIILLYCMLLLLLGMSLSYLQYH